MDDFKPFITLLIQEIKSIKQDSALPALLTFQEVMKILRIERSKLYTLVGHKDIATVRIGSKILFEPGEVRKFINEHKNQKEQLPVFNVNNFVGHRYIKNNLKKEEVKND